MGKARVIGLELRYRPVETVLTGEWPWAYKSFAPSDSVTLKGLRRGLSYEGHARNHGEGGTVSSWAPVTFVIDDTTRTGTAALPPSSTANVASAWISGGAITYTATAGTPATATISVASGTLRVAGADVTYAASSVSVTGTNGATVPVYLYYQDFNLTGGSKTLFATTDYSALIAQSGNVYAGTVSVVFPATGAPPGGGSSQPPCVVVDAWVLRVVDGKDVPTRAGDIVAGDYLRLASGGIGLVSYSETKPASCVRIHGASDYTLSCSVYAPLGRAGGGQVLAPDSSGIELVAFDGGFTTDRVAMIVAIGQRMVQHITCENDFFLAGDSIEFLFSHHNIKRDDP